MKLLLRARMWCMKMRVVSAYAAAVTLVSGQGISGSPSADLMVLMGH